MTRSSRPTKALASDPYLEWTYEIALELGKGRAELIDGRASPLTSRERAYWIAFFKRRNERRTAHLEDLRSED